MLHYTRFLAAILGIAIANPCMSKTIDFDLPATYYGPTYSQDGFTISYTYYNSERPDYQIDGSRAFTNWVKRDVPSYNAGGANASLANNFSGGMTNILRSSDGSIFSFEGISLADFVNSDHGGAVDFIFNYASGGSHKETVTLSKTKGLQDFSFSQKGLLSVAFYGQSTVFKSLQFDFIKVNGGGVSGVPEPSIWAFMLIGFGIVGYSIRRTRQKTMRMQIV